MIPSAPIRLTDNSGPEIRATPVEPENKRSAAAKQSWEKRRSEKSVQQAEADRKRQRYEAQEAKRAPQAQIDQRVTLVTLIVLAAVMFIATAILTADGTIASAVLARFAGTWMAYVLFGAIEVAVLVFMLVYYVKGSRVDDDGKPVVAVQWFVAMVFASMVAVGLSIYHVLDVYEFAWTDPDMWVGISIRLVVALFFVLVSKALASTIFAKAIRL